MGLDFSYLLYFERHNIWTAFQSVVDIASPHQPPTRVIFPDHEHLIPLATWSMNEHILHYDDPELDFSTSLNFDRDEAIDQYLHDRDGEHPVYIPSNVIEPTQASIGTIYLTIYQQPSDWYPPGYSGNLVAFNFGTTGTRMSLLFDQSHSIRKTFVRLLESVPGICGVFNREISGELFWLKGKEFSVQIGDPTMMPDQIEAELIRHKS